MVRKMSVFMAFVLALVMALTLLPVTALAAYVILKKAKQPV